MKKKTEFCVQFSLNTMIKVGEKHTNTRSQLAHNFLSRKAKKIATNIMLKNSLTKSTSINRIQTA